MKKVLYSLIGVLGLITIAKAQPTNGLITKYSFNTSGIPQDESGNGNHATSSNATLGVDRFGNPNQALDFNGSSNYVTLPDSLLTGTAHSISLWIYPRGNGVVIGQQVNALPASSNGYTPIIYVRNDNKLNIKFWDGFVGNYASTGNVVSANDWLHVVITADQTGQKVYINGVLDSTISRAMTHTPNLIKAQIGAGIATSWPSAQSGAWYYNGIIDDVHIYNRKISQNEVQQLYNMPDPFPTKLIAKYSFNNQNTQDESGNNNHGTGANITPATDRFGNQNHAYAFNGTSSVIELPDSLLNRYPLTVSLWFKTATNGVILGQQENRYNTSSASRVPIMYVGQDRTLYANFWDNGGSINTNTVNVADNQWHHIVLMSFPNIGQVLYIDNQYSGIRANQLTPLASLNYNQIGTGSAGGSWPSSPTGAFYFDGIIDDVNIFDNSIDSTTIDSLFNAPNPATVSINEKEITEFNVFPNPVQNKLYIDMETNAENTFYIHNINGKLINTAQLSTSFINVEQLKKGFYILTIRNEQNNIMGRARFIKKQ